MPTPPPELKRGPKWLREMINSLRAFAIETQPLPGVGVQINDSPSGRAINARAGGGGGGVAAHPFEVHLRKDDQANVWQARVEPSSKLYSGFGSASPVTVAGLDDEFPVVENTKIWLEITLSSWSPSRASVEHGVNGWVGHPNCLEYNVSSPQNYTQTKYFKLLGQIEKKEDSLMVVQLVRSHLSMISSVTGGRLASYAVPYG